MKRRETSTVTKLLFFSFRLIFATAQPSAQERNSTISETSATSSSEPMTDETVCGTTHQ